LTIEDSSGFWIIAFWDIVSAVSHDPPNDKFVGDSSNSNQVVLILAMFSPPKITQIALGA